MRAYCEISFSIFLEKYTKLSVGLGYSNFLLDMSLMQGNKSKNELLGTHQDKKLLHSEQSTKLKGNFQNGRRYLQMTYPIKG